MLVIYPGPKVPPDVAAGPTLHPHLGELRPGLLDLPDGEVLRAALLCGLLCEVESPSPATVAQVAASDVEEETPRRARRGRVSEDKEQDNG